MRRHPCASIVALSVFIATQPAAAPPPPTYYSMQGATITEIGTLGGSVSEGADINNFGAIVGSSTDAGGFTHAFYFANGNLIDISIGSSALAAWGAGVNDDDEVVGQFYTLYNGGNGTVLSAQAFYWKPGTPFTALENATGWGHPVATATSINESGIIAGGVFGGASTASGQCTSQFPVSWNTPTSAPAPFKCPAHYGAAGDINSAGSIVGTTYGTYPPTMFRYIGGANASVPVPPTLLGLTLASIGEAHALNDHHNVVGHHIYTNPNASNPDALVYRAFFWNGASTQSTLLGVLPGGRFSKAYDVNEQRMVVGVSDANPYGIAYYQKAYIWHADFGLKELPSLPPPQNIITPGACVAQAVNDRKTSNLVQATGYCMVSGNKRAVRWDIDVRKYTGGVTP